MKKYLMRSAYLIIQILGVLLFLNVQGALGLALMIACVVIGGIGYRREYNKLKAQQQARRGPEAPESGSA